tara:strand:+ start:112 stop:255 length:144 start_codon:yes stop_codon:yes gene_type:complete
MHYSVSGWQGTLLEFEDDVSSGREERKIDAPAAKKQLGQGKNVLRER